MSKTKSGKTGNLRREFEESAQGIAKQFSLDVENVRATDKSRPESLCVIFDSMSDAKKDRNAWIGWSVVWLIFIPPIALYTGYKAWENFKTLDNIESQVKKEVKADSAAYEGDYVSTPDIAPG